MQISAKMRKDGCLQSVDGYTAVIAALGGCGRWRAALSFFAEAMDAKRFESGASEIRSSVLSACSDASQWRAVLSLLDGAPTPDAQGTAAALSAGIAECARRGQWQKASFFWEQVRSGGHSFSEDVYADVLHAYSVGQKKNSQGSSGPNKLSLWQSALALLRESQQRSVRPGCRLYDAAVEVCVGKKNWRYALALIEELRHRGLESSARTVCLEIESLVYARRFEDALALLSEAQGLEWRQESATEAFFESAVTASSQAGQWELSLALLEDMKPLKISMDTKSYVTTVAGCRKGDSAGGILAALGLLVDMDRKQMIDEFCIETTLISCAWSRGVEESWEQSLYLLRRLSEPSQVAIFSVIEMCTLAKQYGTAVELLDELRASVDEVKTPPNKFHHVMTALGHVGRWQDALDQLQHLRTLKDTAKVLKVTRKDVSRGYNACAHSCSLGMQWESALGLLTDAREQKLPLEEGHVITSTIEACAFAGRWQTGLSILFEEEETNSLRLSPQGSSFVYRAAAKACQSQWQQALQLLAAACARRVAMDDTSLYGVVISACASKWELALALLSASESSGLPDALRQSMVHDAALGACQRCQQWQRAVQIMSDESARHKFTDVTYKMALRACESAGAWQWGLKIFDDMRTDEIEPTDLTYKPLISVCERGQQWGLMLELLEEMLEQGHQPDLVTYSLCMGAARKKALSLVSIARRLVPQPADSKRRQTL